MGLSRVRAVFFDLDNTLIDTAGASRRGMLEVTSPRRRPALPGQHSAPSVPCRALVELPSRAWRRVLDSEVPRLQSRRHLRSPGLGRRRTRHPHPHPRPSSRCSPARDGLRWVSGKRLRQGFGPGSYITLRGGPGLNLHHSIFPPLKASLWPSGPSGAETLSTSNADGRAF